MTRREIDILKQVLDEFCALLDNATEQFEEDQVLVEELEEIIAKYETELL